VEVLPHLPAEDPFAGGTGAGLQNLKVFDGGLGVTALAKLGVDLNAYRFMYDDGKHRVSSSPAEPAPRPNTT